jgi:lipoyl(octanoyl) transferase
VDARPELWVSRLGQVPYLEAAELQRAIAAARIADRIPDVLLLLEHPPVLTKGKRSNPAELGMGEQWYRLQGIEVCETDRGGLVTYHGPGQLVAYPIVDLGELGDDVHAYVRRLERVMIESLGEHGMPAQVFAGLTGVWSAGSPPLAPGTPGPQGTPVGESAVPGGRTARKVGSIGIHIRSGVTTHGLAINVRNDLQPFEWIVPCGIEHVRMTSLGRELGEAVDLEPVFATVAEHFAEVFGRTAVPRDRAAIESAVSTASPG